MASSKPKVDEKQIAKEYFAKKIFGPQEASHKTFMSAIRREDLPWISSALRRPYSDPNERDNIGRTALTLSARRGQVDVVKILLADTRTDLNCVDYFGNTPLHGAVLDNRIEIVQLLIKDDRLEKDKEDFGGKTALMIAREHRHNEIVNLLEAKQ